MRSVLPYLEVVFLRIKKSGNDFRTRMIRKIHINEILKKRETNADSCSTIAVNVNIPVIIVNRSL